MYKLVFKEFTLLPAALIILSAAVFAAAQGSSGTKHNERPAAAAPASQTTPPLTEAKSSARYYYEFTQPAFYVRHIVIEHDNNGIGKISFQRLNEEVTLEEALQFSPATAARINALWESLHFLDSEENYQSDRQYPHLGTMRLGMERDSRKRTAEFNWSNNKDAFALVNEYRSIADQAILIFDISVARENQPLNAPKLMELLESMLKRNALSDPTQLVPLLKDLSTDEHVPLIARNHAIRLLKKIQK
ncbi:MAG: hypothetical protein ABR501_08015 [Pyrinomonadaceae bacterium]